MLLLKRLNKIQGNNNIIETNEDNVSKRLIPPTSLTNGFDALLNPISSNKAINKSKTPPLWSETSNHETIK